MLPENVLAALKIFYQKIYNKNIIGILSGTASLVLQMVDIPVGDIDILTDKKGTRKIDKMLSEFRIRGTRIPKYRKR